MKFPDTNNRTGLSTLGLAGCIVLGGVVFNALNPWWIIASIVLPFTATLGDFTVSYYKRLAKVKNSGNFIPGHGGMLDRMDAFTITIPVFYLIFNI